MVLRISGQTFNCDEAIRLSPVEPSSIGRRGDPSRLTRMNSPQFIRNSIVLTIGDCGFDEMAREIDEAAEFLTENFESVQTLLHLPGIEYAGIDIGVRWKDTFTHTDFLPAELIRLAGQLNLYVAISHYPIFDPLADDDEEAT